MIEYILAYLASRHEQACSQEEQELLEAGIARYLLENGIEAEDRGEYYKNYVNRQLKKIAASDLKAYFCNYQLISDVNQIVIEHECDKAIPELRRKDLYELMKKLYSCGLGEKYIPIMEVKQILGKLS